MRKILFAPWVPLQLNTPEPGVCQNRIPGTGCWSKDITEPGVFHQWGALSDGGDPAGNDTMAVVEDRGGNVLLVPPTLIKFAEPTAGWDGRPVLIFNGECVRIAGTTEVLFYTDDMNIEVLALVVCMFNDGRIIDQINEYLENSGSMCKEHREIILETFYKMP